MEDSGGPFSVATKLDSEEEGASLYCPTCGNDRRKQPCVDRGVTRGVGSLPGVARFRTLCVWAAGILLVILAGRFRVLTRNPLDPNQGPGVITSTCFKELLAESLAHESWRIRDEFSVHIVAPHFSPRSHFETSLRLRDERRSRQAFVTIA